MAENTTAASAKRRVSWLAGIAAFFAGLMVWGVVTVQPGASFTPGTCSGLAGWNADHLDPEHR